jgi:hypothetical protein
MKVSQLIIALGGPAKVSRELGLTTAAVSNWSAAERVPPMHELPLWRMATAAGLDWTPPGAEGLALVAKPQVAA